MSDVMGFLVPLAFVGVVGIVVSLSRLPRVIKILVYTALALRVVGVFGRYYMVSVLYGRSGDSYRYFEIGQQYSDLLWSADISGLMHTPVFSGGKWWGTQFVEFLTGVVIAIIGPSFIGGFFIYSLMAFLGLVGFAVAFHRAYPEVPVTNYLRWIWLFPSLWFWPSSIGKEAVLLMGLGLAMCGFVGRSGQINWPVLAAGIFFVFAIRVQVAAVIIVALILSQWLSLGGRWTLGKVVQGVLILVLGVSGIYFASQHMGIESFDADGVQGYLESNTGRGGEKGSAIEGAAVGLSGIPMALVNILMRPFPWEARNPQMMITAAEILGFWCIVWFRRRQVAVVLRHWMSDRFLRVAVPFIVVYSITLGMLLANVGIIARQRIFLFPFLFLLVEAVPHAARRWASAPARPGSLPSGPPRALVAARSAGVRQ